MSIIGLITSRGSTVTIRRGTRTQQADGSFNASWSDTVTNGKALIESLSSDLAQKLWGQETKATRRAFVRIDTNVTPGDGLLVSVGAYSGERFRVIAVIPRHMGAASRYLELALELTTEAFA